MIGKRAVSAPQEVLNDYPREIKLLLQPLNLFIAKRISQIKKDFSETSQIYRTRAREGLWVPELRETAMVTMLFYVSFVVSVLLMLA